MERSDWITSSADMSTSSALEVMHLTFFCHTFLKNHSILQKKRVVVLHT